MDSAESSKKCPPLQHILFFSPSLDNHCTTSLQTPYGIIEPMASNNIPAGLRSVDIGRFATRAAQVEQAKPVVSYWCESWQTRQLLDEKPSTVS